MHPNGAQMVEAGDAQGMTLGEDAAATCLGTPNHPQAWAPSPPVPLPLIAQLEVLILDGGLAAFPVLQLHTQHTGRPAGEVVHSLVAQPMFSSHITKTLGGRRGKGGCVLKRDGGGWGCLWLRSWASPGSMATYPRSVPDEQVRKNSVHRPGEGAPSQRPKIKCL